MALYLMILFFKFFKKFAVSLKLILKGLNFVWNFLYMMILPNIHWVGLFNTKVLKRIFRLTLDFLVLIRCRVVYENILLLIVLKVIAYFHCWFILFKNIVGLRHWKISFFVVIRRMNLTLYIFLALNIRWCHNYTFSLYHHLLILLLHHLQFLLKNFFFIYKLLKLLLCLQSLAEYILLRWIIVLHLKLVIDKWILSSLILKS